MQIIEEQHWPGTMNQEVFRANQAARRIQGKRIDKKSDLYKVCEEFESLFIKQMLNIMRKTVNKSGFLDGGFAEELFEDMLYDEYSKKMAKNANFGLANLIYGQLAPGNEYFFRTSKEDMY